LDVTLIVFWGSDNVAGRALSRALAGSPRLDIDIRIVVCQMHVRSKAYQAADEMSIG
jgi:hypothetical protein